MVKGLTRKVYEGINAAGQPAKYVRIGGAWWSVYSTHSTKALARKKAEYLRWLFPKSAYPKTAPLRVVKLSPSGRWAVVQRVAAKYQHLHTIWR